MKTKLYCTLLAMFVIFLNESSAQTLVKKMSSVSGGDVYAVYKNGSSYFIGGTFNYVGLNTGYGALTKTNNDYPDMNFPNFNGQIKVVIPDNGSGWYVGGSFSSVGGVAKSNLVHIKSDFTVDPAFTANTNGEVRTLFKVGGRLYVGGAFTTVNGASRSYAAAVSLGSGALLSGWNPAPNSYVNTITAVYGADTTIWLGGQFTTINSGLSRPYLAKVNTTSGSFVSGSLSADYIVNKLLTRGDSVFIGGAFTRLGLKTDYLSAITEGNTKSDQTMPNANGRISCILPDGSGGWYVGGYFTQIGGVSKSYIAHILSNKTVDANFTANCNSAVLALLKDGSRLYLGGQFSTVNGTARNYLAAVSTSTGALVANWSPNPNSYVYTLALQNDLVLAGGIFTNVKGKNAYRFAALNKTDGTPQGGFPGYNSTVNKIAVRGDSILVGGSYYYGAYYSPYSAKLSTSSITLDPNFPATNGAITAVVSDGSGNYYVAGSFTTIGGVNQAYVAKLNSSLAVVTAWAPSVNNQVNTMVLSGTTLYIGGRFTTTNGVSRPYISALSTTNPGNNKTWNSSMNNYVNTIVTNGTDIYVGGTFTLVNGVTTRNRLSKFDMTGNLNATWDPNASGGGNSVEEIAIAGSNILAGGSFTTIGSTSRNYLAKLNNTNGAAVNWATANSYVYALNSDGTTCYVGGYFTSLTSTSGTTTSRNYIGGITISNGNITAFNPAPNSYVYAIKKSGSVVYFGGQFTTVSATERKYIASASSSNGTLQSWNPAANSTVNSIFIDSSKVFLGGSFTGFQEVSRTYASALKKSTKAFTSWAPTLDNAVYDITYNSTRILIGGIFRNVNGSSRNAFAAFNLNGTLVGTNLNLTKAGGSNVTVRSIFASSANSNVYVGGNFDQAGSSQRNNFVEADITSGAGTVLATNPYADDEVYAIQVNGNNIVYGGDFRFSNFILRTYLGIIRSSTGNVAAWNPIPSTYGYVNDIAYNYNRIFVGGSFDQINGATHNGAAAFALTSGALLAWDPQLVRAGQGYNAEVNAIAADSNNVYLGGYFDQVKGVSRNNAAAVSALSAAVGTWNPGPNYIVNALNLNGTNLFLGGNFTFCKGASRSYIAKIDSATGLVDASWNPSANSYVYALTASGANLYVGGRFTTIGGITRNSLAAVNMTSGVVTGFNPDIKSGSSQGTVNTLAFDESNNLYVGGAFNTAKGSTRNNVASFTVSGAGTLRSWDPNANGNVNSIAISGTTIYLGGQFTTLAGGTTRNRLASVNNTTGALLTFNPNMNSYVHSLTVSGSNLYVGGQFTTVNGGSTTRNYLAAYNTSNGNLASWNPVANSYVFALAATADTVFPGGYYTTLNGTTRNRLAGVRAAAGTALLPFNPDVNSTVRTNYISGRVLLSGGDFTTIGGANRSGFAVFILPGGTTSKSAIAAVEDNIIAKAPQNQFVLYPNPSSNGVVTVRLNEKVSGRVTIKITTMDGKPVYQKAYDVFNKSDLLTLNAENLANGSYIVNVIGATTNWKQTLIINK